MWSGAGAGGRRRGAPYWGRGGDTVLRGEADGEVQVQASHAEVEEGRLGVQAHARALAPHLRIGGGGFKHTHTVVFVRSIKAGKSAEGEVCRASPPTPHTLISQPAPLDGPPRGGQAQWRGTPPIGGSSTRACPRTAPAQWGGGKSRAGQAPALPPPQSRGGRQCIAPTISTDGVFSSTRAAPPPRARGPVTPLDATHTLH